MPAEMGGGFEADAWTFLRLACLIAPLVRSSHEFCHLIGPTFNPQAELRSTTLLLRLPLSDPDTLPHFMIPRRPLRNLINATVDRTRMDHVVVVPACATDSPCNGAGGIDTLLFLRTSVTPFDGEWLGECEIVWANGSVSAEAVKFRPLG